MFRVIGVSAIVAMLVGMVLVASTFARNSDAGEGPHAESPHASSADSSVFSIASDAVPASLEESAGPAAQHSPFTHEDQGFGFIVLGPGPGDAEPDADTNAEAPASDEPVPTTNADADSYTTPAEHAEPADERKGGAGARTDQHSAEPARSVPGETPSRPDSDDTEEPSRESRRTPDVRELMKQHPGTRATRSERTRTTDGGVILSQLQLEDGRDTDTRRNPSGSLGISGSPSSGGAGQSASDTWKAGEGCSIQCIKSGIAYAYGVGAKLEVKTDTPARVWIVVWNDNGYHKMVDSGNTKVMSFSHIFNDLKPGTTYQAMAVAEDSKGYASHGYGSFYTLVRNVEVSIMHAKIVNKPYDSDTFYA